MAVTFVSAAAKANTSSLRSVTVSAPATITSGNLLVAVVYAAINGSTTPTAPTGWTQQFTNQGANDQLTVWTKAATGTEPSSYAFTGNGYMSASVLQYSGTTALDAAPVAASGVSATPITPGGAANTVADQLLLVFCTYNGEGITGPSGSTLRSSAAASGYSGISVYDRTQGSAGQVPQYSAAMSASDIWRTGLVLLQPSAPVDTATPAAVNVAAGATVTGTAGVALTAAAAARATVTGSGTVPSALSAAVAARASVSPQQTAAVSASATFTATASGTSNPQPMPTPPPPVVPADIYRASHTVTYTVDASLNGSPVAGATGMQPIGGTITDTNKPGVRRTLNLELAPSPGLYALLAPEGTVLTVTAHVAANNVPVATVPMGVYDIDTQTLTEGGGKLTVTAPDKWQRLIRATFPSPTASEPTKPVTAQIASLVRAALGNTEAVVVTATSQAVMGTQTWQGDRAQAIIDLAAGIGAWCFFDRNGVFTVADIPAVGGAAKWLVDASPSGVLVSMDRSRSRTNTHNVVAISSTAASGQAFAPQYVWDNDSSSPTYAGPDPINHPEQAGPFGVSIHSMTTQLPLHVLDAQQAARARLAIVVGLASQVSLSMTPNVNIDAFDSINVMPPRERYDIARVLEEHMVDTVTHQLDLKQPMHIDGRSTRADSYT